MSSGNDFGKHLGKKKKSFKRGGEKGAAGRDFFEQMGERRVISFGIERRRSEEINIEKFFEGRGGVARKEEGPHGARRGEDFT